MKIDRQKLIDALAKVKPGLASNDIIEQSMHFIFDDDKIRTYNDEIAITQKFESGLQGAVSAKEFYDLFNKIPDESITAEIKDDKFLFKGKNKQISFNIDSDIVIPPIEVAGPRAKCWMKLPDNFADAIKFCIFSASKNMTMLALTGILLSGKQSISCDNFRATRVTMKTEIKKEFLLAASSAQELVNYKPSKYYMDTNWIHFINEEGTAFSCRQISEEYPKGVFDIFDVKGKKVSLPDELKEILERSQILVTNDLDDKWVNITIKKGWLECVAKGVAGQITEKIKSKYNGKEFTIIIHPALLMEILKRMSDVIVGENQLLFKDDKGFEHVILLIADNK